MSFLGFNSKGEVSRKNQEINKFQQIIDCMPSVVMLCEATHDHKVFYMNETAHNTISKYRTQMNASLGARVDVGNAMGNSIHQFHSDPEMLRSLIENSASSNFNELESTMGELTFIARAYPIWDNIDPDKVLCYMACLEDVSALKKAEIDRNRDVESKRHLDDRVQQIATAMEEMSASVGEVARNASHASEAAVQVSGNAINGQEVVGAAVEGMRKVAGVVRESSDIIAKLGEKSDEVKEIVTIIENIAEQTHLLALNAAIEAARAGEEGRGFAVVADEVKKLAESTTRSTKQTADILEEIVKVSANAVSIMEQGREEAASGEELSGKAGEALDKIVTEIESVKNVITQIATASEQQSATAEEIAQNLDEITRRSDGKDNRNGKTIRGDKVEKIGEQKKCGELLVLEQKAV